MFLLVGISVANHRINIVLDSGRPIKDADVVLEYINRML
jgi:hypothetical protein